MRKDPEQLLKNLVSTLRLPTLPTVALRLHTLRKARRLDAGTLAGLIRLDPALCGRTTALIASRAAVRPVHGRTPTLRTSLLLLGVRHVESLLDDLASDDQLRPAGADTLRFPYARFWRRSINAAIAAELLTEAFTETDPQEGWMAGLMQDVGQLALCEHLGAEYMKHIMRHASAHEDLADEERRHLGLTHAEVSAELLRQWSFNDRIVDAVAAHASPPKPTPETEVDPFQSVIYLSGIAALTFIYSESRSATARFALMSEHLLPIGAAQARRMLKEIERRSEEWDSLFLMNEEALAALRSFGGTTTEGTDHEAWAAEENQESNACVVTSSDDISLDPMTGFADRGTFERSLAEALARADRAVGLICLQAAQTDESSSVSPPDRDALMHTLSDRLRTMLSPDMLAGRLGPEIIAIICCGHDLVRSSQYAQRLINSLRAESNAGTPTFGSLNAGVAAREPDGHPGLNRPHVLLRCAGQAAAAAREAGGDCVRAFKPRSAA